MVSWRVAVLFLSFLFAPFEGILRAQDAQPNPAQSPQTAPDLLPESITLPPLPPESALPRDLLPEIPKPVKNAYLPTPGSAEQQEKDRIRFRQIRTIAVRDPFAIYLAKRAAREKTEEGKREYFRAYYTSMAVHMRKLEPKLKPLIDAFEGGYIARYSPTGVRPTVPLRDLERYEKAQTPAGLHR